MGLQLAKSVFEAYGLTMETDIVGKQFEVRIQKATGGTNMFGQKITETLTVVEIENRTAGMPSMATARGGFSMSFANSYIAGIFEREDGERIRLLMSEKQAANLRPGNKGTATYKGKELKSFVS